MIAQCLGISTAVANDHAMKLSRIRKIRHVEDCHFNALVPCEISFFRLDSFFPHADNVILVKGVEVIRESWDFEFPRYLGLTRIGQIKSKEWVNFFKRYQITAFPHKSRGIDLLTRSDSCFRTYFLKRRVKHIDAIICQRALLTHVYNGCRQAQITFILIHGKLIKEPA